MISLVLAAAIVIPLGLDLYMLVPEENPLTEEKIALGRRLFFDRRLSRDGSVSCASCHDPARAFTDGRPVAIGVFSRVGRRNAPTLINRGYGRSFLWDVHPPEDILLQAQQLDRDYLRVNAPVLGVADLLARPLGEAAGEV